MKETKETPKDLELDAPEGSFELEQIWFVMREKAWLIVLCALVGILGGLAYIRRTPLTYHSQSVIQVDPEPLKVLDADVQQQSDPIGENV